MKGYYVIIKRCVNCGSTNNVNNKSCLHCKHLFRKELLYEDWVKHNTKLAENASDSE